MEIHFINCFWKFLICNTNVLQKLRKCKYFYFSKSEFHLLVICKQQKYQYPNMSYSLLFSYVWYIFFVFVFVFLNLIEFSEFLTHLNITLNSITKITENMDTLVPLKIPFRSITVSCLWVIQFLKRYF